MTTRLRVPEGAPRRLDRFLAEALGATSRRAVQEDLAAGRIRVQGRRARKGDWVEGGSEVEVEIESLPDHLEPEPDLTVGILHEDEALVAVDKPTGMPSHALRTTDRGTVANFLVASFPGIEEASERPLDAGLVHRLDGGTSGVLLAARTRLDWVEMRRQFAAREVRKIYVARVAGIVSQARTVAAPLAADPGDRRKVRVVPDDTRDARPARTLLRPIRVEDGATVIEIEIETGMRHQIRAHLASIDHPVVGDVLYGGPQAPRLALHARELTVRHPRSGRRVLVTSPPPRGLA